MHKRFWLSLLILCLPLLSLAIAGKTDPIVLAANAPSRYIVKVDDSHWTIAKQFLVDPKQWDALWEENLQPKQRNSIVAGDELLLIRVDGKPQLTFGHRAHTLKLAPKIRSTQIETLLPSYELNEIYAYLTETHLISASELQHLPIIVAVGREHLISRPGDKIYVRNLPPRSQQHYKIIRPGQTYLAPATDTNYKKQLLGIEALHVGDASVTQQGDPAILQITDANQEIKTGDYLVSNEKVKLPHNFMLRKPANRQISGHIIDIVKGMYVLGTHDLVVIDRGSQSGLAAGHVLAIYTQVSNIFLNNAPTAEQTLSLFRKATPHNFTVPKERLGELMIFRVYQNLSYGLVLHSQHHARIMDEIRHS